MAEATSTTTRQIRAFIECCVCFEILDDPRVLPCLHSYCLKCLQGTWASKQPKDTVHCPLCRERFVIPDEGVYGIRKDHRVNALMGVYDRKTANKSQFCGEHKGKALDIYCRSCKTAVCSSCLIKDHSGHSVSEVREFLDGTRKQMSKELEKLSKYEKKMNKKKNRLEKNDKFLKEIDSIEKAINKKADELKQRSGNRQVIEEQRLSLLEELCIIKQKQLKEMMKERDEMDNHSAEIESMKSLCNAMALTENPMEISKAMNEFRTTSDKLAENHQVQLERQLPSTKVSFQAEEVHSGKNIVGSITAVTMRLIKRLDISDICGLTKLESNIYVLRGPSNFLISVYEDQTPFRLQAEIHLTEIKIAADIATSEKLKCLYVTDSVNNCIWKITVDDHRVTRWLSDVGDPFTLSVTSDDHILNLRDGKHRSQLEIYGSDAIIIRILQLPTDIKWPLHAVQKPSGQFIIMHKANHGNGGPWVISQLTNDGKISEYYLSNIGQLVNHPWHIHLDLEKDRVFLASCSEHGVILLDYTSHNWNEIRLTEKETGSCEGNICLECIRIVLMHYDTRKKQLLIGNTNYIGLLIVELS